jgi:hypothetical protein
MLSAVPSPARTFPQLDDLRGAGRWVRLELSAFRPRVGAIVMTDVAEQKAAFRAVDDQPNVGVYPNRPEAFILRLVESVKTQARC